MVDISQTIYVIKLNVNNYKAELVRVNNRARPNYLMTTRNDLIYKEIVRLK